MSTPTPTPRTNAAVKLTFAAGHNTVCPNFARTLERELTALTAERDQLRAEVEWLNTAEADQAKWAHHYFARAEKAERAETVAIAHWNGALERAMKAEAERDLLRAEVERCNDIINRASVQFFHDGTDRETAAKMLTVLNEAKP